MTDTEQAKRGFTWPDRYWLIALGGCLLVVFLWIGAATSIMRSRELTLTDNNRELSSLVSALTEQTARSLQGVEFTLRRTSVWTLDPRRTQTSPDDMRAFLRQEIDGVPQIRQLEVVDADGNRIATSLAAANPVSIATRPYFQALMHATGNSLVMSKPMASLLDGRPTFAVALRLEDAQGNFKGAVLALIEDAYFHKFYEQVDLGPGTTIRLLRTDGTPVVALENSPVGRPPSRFLSVQRPVPGFPLEAEVARDETVALAMWRASTIDELIGVAALSLFIAVLAIALVRQVRTLRQVNSRLQSKMEDVLVATVEDVTQRHMDEQARHQLESQLRQSQKLEALGTFAVGIAHDFNNLLGAILGYGERALHAVVAGTPEQRYIEQVLNAGERARSLVERILTFSRSGITTRLPVHLQPVVTETIDLLKVQLTEAIQLEVKLDARDAFVAGDPAQMHQVVMNLCRNAIHAMPEGGTLQVTLALQRLETPLSLSHGAVDSGECVRLTVIDTGVGMSPDLLERIFNPFFTTRKAGEGTGLGLALVEGIVREYSGGIDVQSAVGQGTRFDVYLPVIDAAAVSADPCPSDTSSACSSPFTRRWPRAWAWRSAGPSSRRTADG
jgi:signal transduction histidine kinase